MNSTGLKLYYFNLRARAEFIRLILAAGGLPWEDARFDYKQWPQDKPKMLLGQVPVLELPDNTQLPQSFAIARYVAHESGLAGKNNLESAKIDAVVDTQWDMSDKFLKTVVFEKDQIKKKEELDKFLTTDLPAYIEKLMKLKTAYSSNPKYFVGDSLSWADIFVYQSMDRVVREAPQTKNKLDDYFKQGFDAVLDNPGIQKYLKERPDTPF